MARLPHPRESAATSFVAATAIALVVLLGAPSGAGAITPRDGAYSSRPAGLPRPDVAFVVRNGRIVRPPRGPALTVRGLRCARGEDREAWATRITLRGGRLRGVWQSGLFDTRGRWLRGESFELSGRWTRPGLAAGRMRFRKTVGRRCTSGWVRWRAAPRDPVSITSAAPLEFAVPGELTITATVTNDGEVVSRVTDLQVRVTGMTGDTPLHLRPELAAVTPSQGTCDPAMRPDEWGIQSSLTCNLGPLVAHARASVAVTLRWSTAACTDPETGYATSPGDVVRQVLVRTPLNDASWRREANEDDVPTSTPLCAPAPTAPVAAPVDEPEPTARGRRRPRRAAA